MSMMLPNDLNNYINKKIDKIIFELTLYCENEIFKKDYYSAIEVLDSLLYWRDIRGDVTDCAEDYINLEKRINNVIKDIALNKFEND